MTLARAVFAGDMLAASICLGINVDILFVADNVFVSRPCFGWCCAGYRHSSYLTHS